MSQIVLNFVAGESLVGKRGYAVYADGSDSEKVKVCTNDELVTVLGILVNDDCADDGEAFVCVSGLCEAVAGAAVEPSDHLMVDGSGKLIAHTGASAVTFARYIAPVKDANGVLTSPDGADGRFIQVLVGGIRVNPAA